MMRHGLVPIFLGAVVVASGAPVHGEEARISGVVVSVDAAGGSLMIEELTAAAGPEPVAERRRVSFGPDTDLELVRRADHGAGSWPQGYTALPLSREELRPGDFVTVVGDRGDGAVRARRISVVRPGGTP